MPSRFQSNRLWVLLVSLQSPDVLPGCDFRECNSRYGRIFTGGMLRQDAEPAVDSLPTSTGITVIQFPHADEEPRHHGAYCYTSSYSQDGHRSAVGRNPIRKDIDDIKEQVPRSGGKNHELRLYRLIQVGGWENTMAANPNKEREKIKTYAEK